MTLDEIRFEATRKISDIFCSEFQKHGCEKTEQLILGMLDGSRGALEGLKGESYSYFIFQRIADDIAKSMIEKRAE